MGARSAPTRQEIIVGKATALVGILALVCLGLAGPGMAADYEIKLTRTRKKGETYRMVVDVQDVMNTLVSSGGKNLQQKNKKTTAHLDAKTTVLAVDKRGQPMEVSYTIGEFKGSIDGTPVKTPAAGKVVTAKRDKGKTLFALKDGGEMSPDVRKLLKLVVHLSDPSDPTDDEIFGPVERKKVGEIWTGNMAMVTKKLADENMAVEKKDISAVTKLTKVHAVGSVPCMNVEAKLTVKNFRLSQIPNNMKIVDARMSVTLSGDFPIDTTKPRLWESEMLKMAMHFQMPTPNGNIDVRTMTSKSVTRKFTPLQAGGK